MDKRLLKQKELITGKIFKTKNGGDCLVIDYQNCYNVLVKFYKPECIVKCELSNLRKGVVKNPLQPSFCGKGFIGIGKYGIKDEKAYSLWQSLLVRAYSEKYHKKQPTYKDVEVCKDWYNFQNFAEWCYSQKFFNAKDDKGKPYQLDKDILLKGNKIYSPEVCCFVPSVINNIILNSTKTRGKMPLGVLYDARVKKFKSLVRVNNTSTHLGNFNTPEQAFQAYKVAKESYIKEVANLWKDRIDARVYKSLIGWEISIED